MPFNHKYVLYISVSHNYQLFYEILVFLAKTFTYYDKKTIAITGYSMINRDTVSRTNGHWPWSFLADQNEHISKVCLLKKRHAVLNQSYKMVLSIKEFINRH